MAERKNWVQVLEAYKDQLADACSVQVILQPSQVVPERFHVSLSPLPHPGIVGNGRVRLRLRAQVGADLPPSKGSISDALEKSLSLAFWFSDVQGFSIVPGVCGLAYHQPLRSDDEMFVEGREDRTYGYEEFWLVELEIDYESAAEAVTQGD